MDVERSYASSRAPDGTLTLRKVRRASEAGDAALKVILFRGMAGAPCGWFIGPLLAHAGRMSIPYLPKSKQTPASVAVVRAIRMAKTTRGTVCLVDPDDLWDAAWQA